MIPDHQVAAGMVRPSAKVRWIAPPTCLRPDIKGDWQAFRIGGSHHNGSRAGRQLLAELMNAQFRITNAARVGEIVSTMCSRLHCEVTVADCALTPVDQITADGTVSARREPLGEKP